MSLLDFFRFRRQGTATASLAKPDAAFTQNQRAIYRALQRYEGKVAPRLGSPPQPGDKLNEPKAPADRGKFRDFTQRQRTALFGVNGRFTLRLPKALVDEIAAAGATSVQLKWLDPATLGLHLARPSKNDKDMETIGTVKLRAVSADQFESKPGERRHDTLEIVEDKDGYVVVAPRRTIPSRIENVASRDQGDAQLRLRRLKDRQERKRRSAALKAAKDHATFASYGGQESKKQHPEED